MRNFTFGTKRRQLFDLPDWMSWGRHDNDHEDKSETEGLSIPDHKDWYKEGHVTKPYDQAGCGACWAFSTSAAVESLAHISGADSELTEYSVQ